MHYSLVHYPKFDRKTNEKIEAFRRKYDPFVDCWKPHISLIFPVPFNEIEEAEFTEHVETVLKKWEPFSIRIGGFSKSWDHWLFLLLKGGNEKTIALHDELYTGILSPYLRSDIEYVPHMGIGLFVKKDAGYNPLDPKTVDYDAKLYLQALKEAKALNIDSFDTVNRLTLNKVILKVDTSLHIDRTVVSSKEIRL